MRSASVRPSSSNGLFFRIFIGIILAVCVLFGGTYGSRAYRLDPEGRSRSSLIEGQDHDPVLSLVANLRGDFDEASSQVAPLGRLKRDKNPKKECIELDDATAQEIAACDSANVISTKQPNVVFNLSSLQQQDIDKFFSYSNESNRKNSKRGFMILNSKIQNFFAKISPEGRSITVTIKENRLLEKMEFQLMDVYTSGKVYLDIQGNSKLTNITLKTLKQFQKENNEKVFFYNDHLQGLGECIVPSPLPSFDDLEDCVYTTTGLLINRQTKVTSDFPQSLTEIRGCLNITRSALENIDFVKNLTVNCTSRNEIRLNKLCVHPRKEIEIEAAIGETNFINKVAECDGEWFVKSEASERKSECKVIIGDLEVSNVAKDENLSHYKNITEIRGKLAIINTKLETIDFLPNLKNITPNSQGDVIRIEYNKDLKQIKFDALEKIEVSKGYKYIYVFDNGEYEMPEEEKDAWERKFPGSKAGINPNSKVEVANEPSKPRNNTSKGKKDDKDKDEERKEDGGMSGGAIAGIVAGIIVAFACIIVGGVLVAYWVFKRRYDKKHKEYIGYCFPLFEGHAKLLTYSDKRSEAMRHAVAVIKQNQEAIKKDREERQKMAVNQEIEEEQKDVRDVVCDETQYSEKITEDDPKKAAVKREAAGKDSKAPEKSKEKGKPKKQEKQKKQEKSMEQEKPKEEEKEQEIPKEKKKPNVEEKKTDKGKGKKEGDFITRPEEDFVTRLMGPVPTDVEITEISKEIGRMKNLLQLERTTGHFVHDFTCNISEVWAEKVKLNDKLLEMKKAILQPDFQKKYEQELGNKDVKKSEQIVVGEIVEPVMFRKADNRKNRAYRAVIDHINKETAMPFISRKESVHWKCHPAEECGCDLNLGKDGPQPNTRVYGIQCEEVFNMDKKKFKEKEKEDKTKEIWKHQAQIPVTYEQSFCYTASRMALFPQDMLDHIVANIGSKNFKLIDELPLCKAGSSMKSEFHYLPNCTVHKFIPPNYDTRSLMFYTTIEAPKDDEKVTQETNDESFAKAYLQASMQVQMGKWIELKEEPFIRLCQLALKNCEAEPVVEMQLPVRIFGEVHGKSDDLKKLLSVPLDQNCGYLFLGNYLSDWNMNVNTLVLLFAMKAQYGKNCVLLRGMTECKEVNRHLKFYSELKEMFPDSEAEVFDAVNKVFACLPLACRVGERILCTASGIAPDMEKLKDIKLPIENLVPDTLPFNLLFASPNYTIKGFFDNADIGAGYYFGEDEFYKAAETLQFDIMFTSRILPTGWGKFGGRKYLYSLCTAMNADEKIVRPVAALADIDKRGKVHIRVITQDESDDNVLRPQLDTMTMTSTYNDTTNTKKSLKSESKSVVKSDAKPVSEVKQPDAKENKSKQSEVPPEPKSGQKSQPKSGVQPKSKSGVQPKSKSGPPTAPVPPSRSGPSQGGTSPQVKPK